MEKFYKIESNSEVNFHNNVTYCIGTGRMGLALHKEYYNQLKMVQDTISFSHLRGHDLFCDDMAIYHEYENAQLSDLNYGLSILKITRQILDRFSEFNEINIHSTEFDTS